MPNTPLNPNAINVNAGFEFGSGQVVDSRQYLTKSQMLAISDDIMPDSYFAICPDDGSFYIYNKTNTVDPVTGKFRPSNSVNIQYATMPEITSDMVGQIVQYIGETTTTAPIYNKGCWYQAVATQFYAWKDSINDVTVWTDSETPDLLSNVYDSNLDPTANFVTDYSESLNLIVLDDHNSYNRDNTQDTASYHWEELTDSKLKNAILGYDFEGGKIWKGTSEDFEALDSSIKNNTNIIFIVFGASDSNWSIIDDDTISAEKTMSSLKAYATFVTANTNALVNYYKKSETFSKTEILQMTSRNLQAEIVTSLPSTDISTSTIYLISASSGYDQWMYINGGWVKIGTTNIDLSDYATKTELNAKQDALTFDTVPTEGSSNPVTSGGIYNGMATTLASANEYTDSKQVMPVYNANSSESAIDFDVLYSSGKNTQYLVFGSDSYISHAPEASNETAVYYVNSYANDDTVSGNRYIRQVCYVNRNNAKNHNIYTRERIIDGWTTWVQMVNFDDLNYRVTTQSYGGNVFKEVMDYEIVSTLDLTANSTYTLDQIWQKISDLYDNCHYVGNMQWASANTWYLTDGVRTYTITNGRFDFLVQNRQLWHQLKGTIIIGEMSDVKQLICSAVRNSDGSTYSFIREVSIV